MMQSARQSYNVTKKKFKFLHPVFRALQRNVFDTPPIKLASHYLFLKDDFLYARDNSILIYHSMMECFVLTDN